MRFAFVPFVALAASFTLATAQTTSIDPSVATLKIDLMQRPTPVYILNFPEVQPVSGTVSVDNFPAVQTIEGTVTCINAASSPTSATHDLLDARIDLPRWSGASWSSAWVPSDAFRTIVVVTGMVYLDCSVEWRYAASDSGGWTLGPSFGRSWGGGNATQGGVMGPECRVVCQNNADFDGWIDDLRVFLRK